MLQTILKALQLIPDSKDYLTNLARWRLKLLNFYLRVAYQPCIHQKLQMALSKLLEVTIMVKNHHLLTKMSPRSTWESSVYLPTQWYWRSKKQLTCFYPKNTWSLIAKFVLPEHIKNVRQTTDRDPYRWCTAIEHRSCLLPIYCQCTTEVLCCSAVQCSFWNIAEKYKTKQNHDTWKRRYFWLHNLSNVYS